MTFVQAKDFVPFHTRFFVKKDLSFFEQLTCEGIELAYNYNLNIVEQ